MDDKIRTVTVSIAALRHRAALMMIAQHGYAVAAQRECDCRIAAQ
jgi:hypothetical protein